ncbi:UNVERIFIED_CONTAM: LINE-1 reverse transcriptase [Sesamum latifolium]|uniref:LINE-1 reverse transcriptase n=1 Tax=Sesamum latifolium TaxID=2727402 RepID=A0AAW2XRR9_9LAMI
MKVDLRKAYDTVQWDFLLATLQLFGFPNSFIKWIEECVTTYSFSFCLNGNIHGFFSGARGLRQGDPMSPYLFVLVMEVLRLSGLCANPTKSQLIISKSAHPHRDQLLHLLGFQEGTLLLIKSVLMAFNIYWGSTFILPKGVVRHIEKLLRTFLWKGTMDSGYAKVAWRDVYLPMEEGGQGIRDIQALNYGLMCRRLWDIVVGRSDSIWVSWVRHYRLRSSSIWTVNIRASSWAWRKLIRLRILVQSHVEYLVGNGHSFSLWHDPWHSLGSLIHRFPRGPQLTGTAAHDSLDTVILDGEWNWPPITDFQCLEIVQSLPSMQSGEDCIRWHPTGSTMMSRDAYTMLRPPGPKVAWYSLLLGPFKIPRNNLVMWLAILQRLSTLDKPWLQHGDGTCILCTDRCLETHSRLFFRCHFARQCLNTVRHFVSFPWLFRGWEIDILWAARRWRGKHLINAAYRTLLSSLVYHIWQERNRRRFQQTERTTATLGQLVIEEVQQRIISAELSSSMLRGWNWFVDSTGPGNRIWLAWEATEIRVDIFIIHVQCIHCRVHYLRSHNSALVTVVYGLNEVIPRRDLWTRLVDILESVGEDPWLVLGDFNIVVDLSEVCGSSGDISTAMEDFRALLLDTGLMQVPSHGACFTWHNRSDGQRSLWKKLD